MTPGGAIESDEALAARARSGDRKAFEALIGRHKTVLYRFVRRYVRDADDGYDVLQDTFIAVWNGLARYDPNRPFAPWLRTVALNKCRDFMRRQKVRRLFFGAYESDPGVPTSSEALALETETALHESARLLRLDNAIARLPAFYKEVLLLTTSGGLSHDEAAAVLKTTAKAVEMRLSRARQKVAQLMREG